jgi:branched-chain amino acid transport system ATP-binding protein
MLEIHDLTVAYPGGSTALHSVSFSVPEGGVTTVLGANGAGKTSLLRAVGGLLPHYRATVVSGSISLDGTRIERLPSWDLTRLGLAQVLEGRHIFTDLSVHDNLVVGGQGMARAALDEAIARTYAQFPALEAKTGTSAGFLSGGEQQMLAIGRATLRRPRLLLLDEPSLGLSPLMMERIADVVSTIAGEGVTVVLVEQNAHLALSVSQQAVVLAHGTVVADCPAAILAEDDQLAAAYLGSAAPR